MLTQALIGLTIHLLCQLEFRGRCYNLLILLGYFMVVAALGTAAGVKARFSLTIFVP